MTSAESWTISGTYLEACNCEAICPCRRIGGRGGRALHLRGLHGRALVGGASPATPATSTCRGSAAVIACQYDDDEPGSPWTFFLYVDERGDDDQREALVEILTGARGGSVLKHFPWAWKESRFLGWRPVGIEIDHTPGRGWFRAGNVEVRIRGPVPDQEPVTCIIPGHGRFGMEDYADLLRVEEGPLAVDLSGRCAYEATFRYSSAEA